MAATTTNHWKLGLFVVAGIGAVIGVLFWIGAQRFRREAFDAVAYFDESVQGLDVGSPVKFRGVTLGTVANITIAPDHRLVQVTSDIYVDAVRSLGLGEGKPDPQSGRPFMPEDLRIQLAAAGITGVRFLEVDFFDPQRYPPPPLPFAPPWNYVPSAPSTLRSLEQAALEFANRLPVLGDQATAALAEGRETLGSVRRLSDELQGDNGQLTRLLARLDTTADTLQTAVRESQLGATASALRAASVSVTGAATGVTGGVADVREDLRADLIALRDTLDVIRALVESLDRDPSVLVRGRRAESAVPMSTK
jgi:phospholipid/cholesterol/gamma-HCH transport system substrate-binding protein